jgi:putative ABC transport system permease protein
MDRVRAARQSHALRGTNAGKLDHRPGYSARRLASRPTYTVLAVLTLALGAGGTAAIFSVVRTLLLDPLPIAREAEVGVFWMPGDWTDQEFLHLRRNLPGFQSVAAYESSGATLEQPGAPLRLIPALSTSADLFDVLGTGPLLGRRLQRGDDKPGTAAVAVISYGLWQELGGDRSIIGRPLLLGGQSRTVVGVMPRGFWFPDPTTRVWLARALNPERRVGELSLIGRVAAGQHIRRMKGPLGAIVSSLRQRFKYPAQWDKTRAPSLTPVREYLVGDVRPGLIATFVAMALILLIACVNVAALMLGQVGGRATEIAVRSALGAGRHRLAQQLVLESLLVGALAGVVGALLAATVFGLLVESLPLGALADRHARLDGVLDGDPRGVARSGPHCAGPGHHAVAGKSAVDDGHHAYGRCLDSGRSPGGRSGGGADRARRAAVGRGGPAASLASLLYGVSAADPPAIAGAVLALVAVGSVAAWFPARRASHTDPAVVLREQ